jgi:hypothetical protein
VSIRRRGKNSWEITISHGFDPVTGERIRTFHSFKGTKRQAEEEQTRLLHRRDFGLSIEPSKLTVAELLREWLKSRPNLAPKTRQGYAHIVEEHLIPDLGTLRLTNLKPANIQLTVYRSLQRINGETFFKSPKGDRVRTIHIGPDLARELKAHRERQAEVKERMGDGYRDTDLVCTTENGEWLNPGSYSAAFRAFREKLDLPAIRLHDLRHTNATLLLDQRVPLKVVSERLGHSTTKLTGDTYAHVLEGQDQQAAKVFDLALRRARKKTAKANGGS